MHQVRGVQPVGGEQREVACGAGQASLVEFREHEHAARAQPREQPRVSPRAWGIDDVLQPHVGPCGARQQQPRLEVAPRYEHLGVIVGAQRVPRPPHHAADVRRGEVSSGRIGIDLNRPAAPRELPRDEDGRLLRAAHTSPQARRTPRVLRGTLRPSVRAQPAVEDDAPRARAAAAAATAAATAATAAAVATAAAATAAAATAAATAAAPATAAAVERAISVISQLRSGVRELQRQCLCIRL